MRLTTGPSTEPTAGTHAGFAAGAAAVLIAIMAASGCVLAARAIFGPFRLGLSVSNPINAETFFGVSAILLLILRARQAAEAGPARRVSREDLRALLILLACGIGAWMWTFRFPFVADDYVHITYGLHFTARTLANLFTVPAGDRFFRPLGYIAYAAEAHIFAASRSAWHAASLLLHVANSTLLYLIARNRGTRGGPARAAALLFLLHGTRPEAVTWIATQFDLWAAFFFFLALLAFLKRVETGRAAWQIASLGALFLALLSKESAYVFPLALLGLVWLDGVPQKRWLRLLAPPFAVTAVVFLYRFILLGGIGGYRTEGGTPFILTISPYRTPKAILLRPWAILDFPINWTAQPEWWLIIALVCGMAATVWLAISASVARLKLVFGLGFLLLAAAPVHEFLLIDGNLEKSRVLYLPAAGFALLLAAALESLRPRAAIAIASAILVFQAAALEHNLILWHRVANLVESTCSAAAADVERMPKPVEIEGMPNTIDGVYFLKTGFRDCLQWAAGKTLPDVVLDTEPRPEGFHPTTVLRWNDRERAVRLSAANK